VDETTSGTVAEEESRLPQDTIGQSVPVMVIKLAWTYCWLQTCEGTHRQRAQQQIDQSLSVIEPTAKPAIQQDNGDGEAKMNPLVSVKMKFFELLYEYIA
jgi:hypothetical protein